MDKRVAGILDFWESKGVSRPAGELVTHRDVNQVSIEIDTALKLLRRKDVLLDVGCGNGFSTSVYAKKCSKVVGVDYSDSMIKAAGSAHKLRNLTFEKADALSLPYKKGSFSVVISTRCLINLAGWEEQKKALAAISDLLGSGGRLILMEGIRQGRQRLNRLRNMMGLPSMPRVWHNRDFDEEKLFPFLERRFDLKKDIRFGIYDVLTRVIYPASIYPKDPKYGTDFHDIAERLFYLADQDVWREYSREACLVFQKK